MTWTLVGWSGVTLSFFGIYLNAHKSLWCWPVWLLSGVAWTALGVHYKDSAMVLAQVGFTVGNVYGWRQWKKASSFDQLYPPGKGRYP